MSFSLIIFIEPFNPLKLEGKGAVPMRPGAGGNIFAVGNKNPKNKWKAVFKKTQVSPKGKLQ